MRRLFLTTLAAAGAAILVAVLFSRQADSDSTARRGLPPKATSAQGTQPAHAGAPEPIASGGAQPPPSGSARPAGRAPYLPAEVPYFANGQLDMTAVDATMTGDTFDRRLSQIEQQMATDADATELQRAYDHVVRKQLYEAGLDGASYRLACGLSLCLGSITSERGPEAQQRWWNEFTSSPATPHTIAGNVLRDLGGGMQEQRFLFVTDPQIKAAAGRWTR